MKIRAVSENFRGKNCASTTIDTVSTNDGK